MTRRQRIVLALRRRKRRGLIVDMMRQRAREAMDAYGKMLLRQIEEAYPPQPFFSLDD